MTRQLPSDDEIRASLKRNRSSTGVEYLGCLIVLLSTAVGVAAGVVAIQWMGGLDAANVARPRPRTYVLLLGGGGMAGLVVGLLAFQLVRTLTRLMRPRSPEAPGSPPDPL
jgi:hypothetical protein